MDPSHRVLLLLVALLCATGSSEACTTIFPDSNTSVFLEVGRSFTATCRLQEGSAYTVDDIEWILGNVSIDRQYYQKINASSVSVTLDVSRNTKGWLYCNTTKKQWPPTTGCRYGIFLDVGYPPLKPENLTCIAVQDGKDISPDLTCSWDAGSRDPGLDTSYTLHAVVPPNNYSSSCGLGSSSCTVNLELFPYHYYVSVWVEAKNGLGSVRSEERAFDPFTLAKPNPPEDIQVLAEANFSTSLLVTWKSPIDKDKMKLLYAIRYCPADASVWTEVPESFTQAHTGSFRLQPLTPYTEYVVQMRCVEHQHMSYWSDWSANATARTAEAEPKTAPDLWRIISSDHRNVTLVWKPPVEANGKIIKYDLEISEDLKPVKTHFVKEGDIIREHWMELKPGNMANIEITATNSVGKSPKATLFIPRSDQELPGVTRLRCRVRDEELEVEWDGVPPLSSAVHLSGFLLEWVNVQDSGVEPRWQRVGHSANTSTLTGFASMKRYNVSVYPMYKYHSQRVNRIQAGAAKTLAVYIQQGPPDEGPVVSVNESKKNSAQLTWKEVPLASRNGFITNYTIFYRAGSAAHWQSVTVRDNIRSYVLTDLASETDYVVRVMASTVAGSKNGSNFNFKTPKYGDGEVEVIVVVVCLSFLFLTVFIIMFCLQKREVIKQLLWPQVPDPSDSSIAHWSPDFPLKTDMPKEEVSVVEVDAFDGKSLFEEDKAVLPLKKDKYLSEEHSSGIGGSSCMSSPRHSVSDSDESDSGQTTASTVQYSSVVASGYKGQTPNHQPPAFARSESTQPLLDCEEHPDLLSESGGHSRNSYFRRGRELEPAVFTQECDAQNAISLAFSPVQEEETSPIVEDPPASSVSYMPQQSGYRPQ